MYATASVEHATYACDKYIMYEARRMLCLSVAQKRLQTFRLIHTIAPLFVSPLYLTSSHTQTQIAGKLSLAVILRFGTILHTFCRVSAHIVRAWRYTAVLENMLRSFVHVVQYTTFATIYYNIHKCIKEEWNGMRQGVVVVHTCATLTHTKP